MEKKRNEPMAVEPVSKLMLKLGTPMILSMVLQAVYNIVDSAFVSNMHEGGEQALNALTLAFPMQILMVAVGIGTGVGANVLTAQSLGQGSRKRAAKASGCAVFLGAVIYLIFMLFGIFGAKAYITSQTSDSQIAAMGTAYLQICCILSLGMSMFAIFEKLLQATGHSVCSTAAQIAGAVTNIILDPLLIYGKGGLPAMGVKGAAYATVIGQMVSFITALAFHIRVNKDICGGIADIRPDRKIIKQIYSVGLPAMISQALISVMTYGLNRIYSGISTSMVTAYGLFYKIQQFLLFAAFGMRDAIMPITAYSYGMGSRRRVKASVRYGQLYTAILMLAGFAALEMSAVPFAGMFGLSGETERLCISAMRIISVSFVFSGINIAFQGVFQAAGCGISSLILSVCRQLLFVFPFAFLFAPSARADHAKTSLMWAVFPIAEILTAVIALILYRHMYRTKIDTLSVPDDAAADMPENICEIPQSI